ncbi:N-acetyl-gamma-glutamyl-phosphate reductase, partial [Thalassospira xiamenensis]
MFGASGYSGAELVRLLHNHPQFSVTYAFSSGARAAQPLADLYPQHALSPTLLLQPWHPDLLAEVCQQVRVIFLALPHEASAELVPQILAQTAQTEVTVFDLSGAFRLRDEN